MTEPMDSVSPVVSPTYNDGPQTTTPESHQEHGLMVGSYVCDKLIGIGTHVKTYRGHHIGTGTLVAIKLETSNLLKPHLPLEEEFYRILGNGEHGIPKLHYTGTTKDGRLNALVLDLLGHNLAELLQDVCDGRFSTWTTFKIGIQLLTRFEYIHSKGVIYRDVRPENFMIGRFTANTENVIHVIDFGHSKVYRDPMSGEHIPFYKKKELIGTARFMSLNSHRGYELSRRDDLEALGYMLVYFIKGSLQWQGVKTKVDDKSAKKTFQKIGEIKGRIPAAELVKGCPPELGTYILNVRDLRFEEEPDYEYLRELFQTALVNEGINPEGDGIFDWTPALTTDDNIIIVNRPTTPSTWLNPRTEFTDSAKKDRGCWSCFNRSTFLERNITSTLRIPLLTFQNLQFLAQCYK